MVSSFRFELLQHEILHHRYTAMFVSYAQGYHVKPPQLCLKFDFPILFLLAEPYSHQLKHVESIAAE